MASKAIASHNGPPAKSSEAPSPTLFLKNLPEKISKQDLRMSLYMLFSTYGPVLDVVAMRNGKMRGMAHVAFRDTQASTQAMRALQDFDFFGKPMKIHYGKNRSHIFNKLEGVYKPINVPDNTSTELQQSIFNAPPVTGSNIPPPAANLPPPPVPATEDTRSNDESHQGVKRRRDDESDEEEAPMEEDDDDVSMEASSDDE